MSWVVDTCVLLDIFEGDPDFAIASADALDAHAADGLSIAPATFVELAPAFHGNLDEEKNFLAGLGVEADFDDEARSTMAAAKAWASHVERKRAGRAPRRPVADALIGAFASVRQGLITRNASDFKTLFPSLAIAEP